MNTAKMPMKTELLIGFFLRLAALDEIVRIIISNARIKALFVFGAADNEKILMDFHRDDLLVSVDDKDAGFQIKVEIDGAVMHEILLGRLKPGVALSRREMLLRGSPHYFARFIPLFDFGPMLYLEHLSDAGYAGTERSSGKAPFKEVMMQQNEYRGEPIAMTELSPAESILFKLFNGLAFAAGYIVGLLRYRLLQNLSIFDLLGAMSRGLKAATPKDFGPKEENSGEVRPDA